MPRRFARSSYWDLRTRILGSLPSIAGLSKVSYSKRCAEASAVKAYQKRGFSLVPGMEIGYVVKDAAKWVVDTERDSSEFDAVYYGKLLGKAWDEVAFVFKS